MLGPLGFGGDDELGFKPGGGPLLKLGAPGGGPLSGKLAPGGIPAPGGPWPGGKGGGPKIVNNNSKKEAIKYYLQRGPEVVHSNPEAEPQEAAYHWEEMVARQASLEENRGRLVGKGVEL